METSLYLPVKRYLEGLGFAVKGEICGCDVVALRDGEPVAVVIAELKLSFTLELVLQAVERTAVCDEVWLAVQASKRGRGREGDARVKKLCRMLGFGLLAVFASGKAELLVEPVAWTPRGNAKRRSKIVDEHRRRRGDPAAGGSTRQPIMTAYRQQALVCAAALARGPARPRDLKAAAPDVAKILRRNVYGWFVNIERGSYGLTDAGRAALVTWVAHLPEAAPAAALASDAGAGRAKRGSRKPAAKPAKSKHVEAKPPQATKRAAAKPVKPLAKSRKAEKPQPLKRAA
jgi:hypothetical protein